MTLKRGSVPTRFKSASYHLCLNPTDPMFAFLHDHTYTVKEPAENVDEGEIDKKEESDKREESDKKEESDKREECDTVDSSDDANRASEEGDLVKKNTEDGTTDKSDEDPKTNKDRITSTLHGLFLYFEHYDCVLRLSFGLWVDYQGSSVGGLFEYCSLEIWSCLQTQNEAAD